MEADVLCGANVMRVAATVVAAGVLVGAEALGVRDAVCVGSSVAGAVSDGAMVAVGGSAVAVAVAVGGGRVGVGGTDVGEAAACSTLVGVMVGARVGVCVALVVPGILQAASSARLIAALRMVAIRRFGAIFIRYPSNQKYAVTMQQGMADSIRAIPQ